MLSGNLPDLMAEISFDFQYQTANPLCRLICFICDQLLSKWPHTAACLSRPDGTEDTDARIQSLFWNGQPLGIAAGSDLRWMMSLPDNEEQILSETRVGIRRQRARLLLSPPGKAHDVHSRKYSGVNEERGREQKQGVAPGKN